jgi:hypothetical protein
MKYGEIAVCAVCEGYACRLRFLLIFERDKLNYWCDLTIEFVRIIFMESNVKNHVHCFATLQTRIIIVVR